MKRSAQNGFRRSETVSQGSSLATPRGELSYMGLVESDVKFPGSGETKSTSGSGPTRKRVRLLVASDVFEMLPLEDSPFLVKAGDTPRVVTVSSSSSSGGSGVARRLGRQMQETVQS